MDFLGFFSSCFLQKEARESWQFQGNVRPENLTSSQDCVLEFEVSPLVGFMSVKLAHQPWKIQFLFLPSFGGYLVVNWWLFIKFDFRNCKNYRILKIGVLISQLHVTFTIACHFLLFYKNFCWESFQRFLVASWGSLLKFFGQNCYRY